MHLRIPVGDDNAPRDSWDSPSGDGIPNKPSGTNVLDPLTVLLPWGRESELVNLSNYFVPSTYRSLEPRHSS